MSQEMERDAAFVRKLRAFAWATGNTGLVLILVAILAWIFYMLRGAGALHGLPLWLIPGAERLFVWVIMLKILAVVALAGWLLASLWAGRLRT